MAGTSQDHSFEGYAIEGSLRDAMSAILAKSRENEFSGLRKSWGVSPPHPDFLDLFGGVDHMDPNLMHLELDDDHTRFMSEPITR